MLAEQLCVVEQLNGGFDPFLVLRPFAEFGEFGGEVIPVAALEVPVHASWCLRLGALCSASARSERRAMNYSRPGPEVVGEVEGPCESSGYAHLHDFHLR
ncbi:MAG: hypothetical protein QOH82_4081 [Mycobacterium sp.]|nr:hypothetical protein [Mycobacterium sp.]